MLRENNKKKELFKIRRDIFLLDLKILSKNSISSNTISIFISKNVSTILLKLHMYNKRKEYDKIKALKTLVWHLSREPMKELLFEKKK